MHKEILNTDIKFDTIENVYSDPLTVRKYALSLKYPILKRDSSPGKTIKIPYNPLSESYIKIIDYFDKKNISITVSDHFYRITNENDYYNSYIHTDPAEYQVLISLSQDHPKDDECYFKHSESGIVDIDYLKNIYDLEYKEKINQIIDDVNKTSHENTDIMHIISKEPIIFNKAVIINCRRFHAPTNGLFGKTNDTSRIIEVYAIKIRSMHKSDSYPYIWYYENTLNHLYCDELCSKIRENSLTTEEIREYKSGIIDRMIRTYYNHIRNVTPDLNEFLTLVPNNMKLNVDSYKIYVTQYESIPWNYEINNIPGTFVFIIQLNDNNTGFTLYNHFKHTTEVIPSKKGSLLIFPKSWLYPITQSRVMVGDKCLITGIISFKTVTTDCNY